MTSRDAKYHHGNTKNSNGMKINRKYYESLYRFGTYAALRLHMAHVYTSLRGQLKCDGTRAETRFRLSVKRTSPFSPFKSVGGGG